MPLLGRLGTSSALHSSKPCQSDSKLRRGFNSVHRTSDFLTKPYSDRTHRDPEAGGGLFSTTHDIFRYGLMLAQHGELDGHRDLSHAAMAELRKEQTGKTKVNDSLGDHLRHGMFGHEGAYGTDLPVNPQTGVIALFITQCISDDQWSARDLLLKTATQIFSK